MIFLKTIRNRRIHRLPQLQTPSNYIKNPKKDHQFCASLISSNAYRFHIIYSIALRHFSVSAPVLETSEEKSPNSEKPLNVFSGKAVGSSVKIGDSEVGSLIDCENAEFIEKLRNLTEEVRSLNNRRNENGETLKLDSGKYDWILPRGKRLRLFELFSDKEIKEEVKLEQSNIGIEDPMVHKELSPQKSKEKGPKVKKPLGVLFRKPVGISVKIENIEAESATDRENAELKEKRNENGTILKLHNEKFYRISPKGNKRRLFELFSDKKIKDEVKLEPSDLGIEDPMVRKDLSPYMRMFTYHLYKKGYLNDAACIPNDTFDFTPFEFSYGREYLQFAAEEFGKDHQEIAKWLYTSDLKSVARFGCPSLCQKSVYAAKYLRRCFRIEEHKVCQKCILKESCKLANKRYKKEDTKLYLVNVIRVLFMYAMESTPQQLVVPKEVKISVNRVLEKVIHLSEELSHDDSSVPPSL